MSFRSNMEEKFNLIPVSDGIGYLIPVPKANHFF